MAAKQVMRWIEPIFDIVYLLTVFIAGGLLYATAETGSLRWQYAVMALILGIGDSFHLIPRIYALTDKKGRDHTESLGRGKFITSITMTLFYLFLWEIGKGYYQFETGSLLSILVYSLAGLRILLCILPQNRWTDKNPPLQWAILRNIPFFLLGMIVMLLFMIGTIQSRGGLPFLWLAVLLSFAFYLPVVLFSGKNPKVGMLMLPKSCAYVAIVLMGFTLIPV